MKEPLSTLWNRMSDAARWKLLHKTDLRGLQKCRVALQPFLRLSAAVREKLEMAYNEQSE